MHPGSVVPMHRWASHSHQHPIPPHNGHVVTESEGWTNLAAIAAARMPYTRSIMRDTV